MLEIQFSQARLPEDGAVALLLADDTTLTGLAAALDERLAGAVSRTLASGDFTGAAGCTATLLSPGGGLSRVVLVGLGKEAALTAAVAEKAGAVAVRALAKCADAVVLAEGPAALWAPSVAFGAVLESYRFDLYHTRQDEAARLRLARLAIGLDAPEAARAAWPALKAVADGVFVTRDLVSEPANILTPAEFAARAEALRADGVSVDVLDVAAMQALGFGALLGVAQGSEAEPKAVIMRWNGGAEGDAPVALIGKGVTFDSGGISIKPAGGMEEMKTDMAGAAAVVGAMTAIARGQAPVNVVGMIGLVENMLSGAAQRPGDVVRSYSGQTIEVQNTDAEGRLVLADLLWYAQDTFRPRAMIDLATLTGAIVVSLGHERAGLFASDDDLATRIATAGDTTGDQVWRMPMGDAYDKLIDSDIADMKNVAGRPGGSITAAQFLKRFTNDVAWAHLDIAGTAWASKGRPGCPKGATGFGVRLLDRLVRDYARV
ncbi:leucyl aminopeptidase [Ameyamaea chiangmaiensis]|uniref:leucyl aminopeptidase n=1 Tax=Ameyamaea chiangmaiensis TaxID=442969 RepID=UPI001BB061E9|nr:leucyl aminopeptidase [Ameyamaea chiangmaiensis]MBS4074643.1 leucyl aminopeptidase [Ameyamaea chiangmaiensis]